MKDIIPGIGLGTWKNTDPKTCEESVKYALNTGYKHIDTAQVYKNEEYVGTGINKAEVSRNDFFLASKVWIDQLEKQNVVKSTEKSLEKLQTSYIDLMYVHWPAGAYKPENTFQGFKQLVRDEKIKYVGVSNFTVEQMREAQEILGDDLIANQVEMHPLLQQNDILEYCQENGLYLVAYSPIARGKVFEVSELTEIAEKHGVSEAQVSLAWLNSKENVVPIPKSSTKSHIKENLDSNDLELDEEDIEKIENISEEFRCVDPEFGPWNN